MNVFLLSMLSVIILNAFMLGAVILNVVAQPYTPRNSIVALFSRTDHHGWSASSSLALQQIRHHVLQSSQIILLLPHLVRQYFLKYASAGE
jgi:hypothetical protein